AEDGIRDKLVTGVQTCALPIFASGAIVRPIKALHRGASALTGRELGHRVGDADRGDELGDLARAFNAMAAEIERWDRELAERVRSEERRVGKECSAVRATCCAT